MSDVVNDSICTVIGHGPSAQGAQLGALIDEHPVIRMNDNAWQRAIDYGARSDYIVIQGPFGVRSLAAYTTAPREAFLSYTLLKDPRLIHKLHLGKPVRWFDVQWFVNAMKPERPGVVNVVPTRGAAAVVMAGELGFKTIRLVGMDSVVLGRITHYAEGASRRTVPRNLGMSYNSRHDYERERDIIRRWAIEREITLEVIGHKAGTRQIRNQTVCFRSLQDSESALR